MVIVMSQKAYKDYCAQYLVHLIIVGVWVAVPVRELLSCLRKSIVVFKKELSKALS